MPSSTAVNSRDGGKRLGCRIFQEVEQIFADGLDVVYKRIRDVKDNSKALGFAIMPFAIFYPHRGREIL